MRTGKRLQYYGFECVFTNQMPSKSSNTTGALPHERISKPCSVFAGYKSTAQPPLMDSQVVAHKRERTRCESVPTYTPAFICSNHRVSLPRSAGGPWKRRERSTNASLFRPLLSLPWPADGLLKNSPNRCLRWEGIRLPPVRRTGLITSVSIVPGIAHNIAVSRDVHGCGDVWKNLLH